MIMVHPIEQEIREKHRRAPQRAPATNYFDQLDWATREFEKKRLSIQDPEKGNVLPTVQHQQKAA
jgi:hypothetical protein